MMKKHSILKISILAIASIMTISLLSFSNSVNAQEPPPSGDTQIEIINELETELTFQQVANRQAVKIKTDPPSEINAGDTGSFTVAPGDSVKNVHLKIAYYVGKTGASEIVEFGFKGSTFSNPSCFTDTPDDISGSHEGCDTSTIKFTFKPN